MLGHAQTSKRARLSAAGSMVAGVTALKTFQYAAIVERWSHTVNGSEDLTRRINARLERGVQLNAGDRINAQYTIPNQRVLRAYQLAMSAAGREREEQVRLNRLIQQSSSPAERARLENLKKLSQERFKALQLSAHMDQMNNPTNRLVRSVAYTYSGNPYAPIAAIDRLKFNENRIQFTSASVMRAQNFARIRQATAGGVILGATALAFGLIAADEYASGRISNRLNKEFDALSDSRPQ